MRRIVLLICCYCLAVAPAAARMYQWRNPATGTTQLSGTPPAWYRGTDAGPRVYVFENNALVDDTGVAVSDAEREALRAAAFGAAAQPPATANTTPAMRHDSPAAVPAVPPPSAPRAAPAEAENAATAANGDKADKAASLKALIDAWDQRQLDQARSLLEMLPGDQPAAPAQRP